MKSVETQTKFNIFSPEIFLSLFVLGFYFVGIGLVQFSLKALLIVLLGIAVFVYTAHVTGSRIKERIEHDYFERLLLSLIVLFVVDLAVKSLLPFSITFPLRALLYLSIMSGMFFVIGRLKAELTGRTFLLLGLLMIFVYMVPSFAQYGLYGSYLNRTGGMMPAFLVGMGTITAIYGLMKIASRLTIRNLYIMIAAITVIAGPLMAALIGYRAYSIIYIMPLIFQFYLERKPPRGLKAGSIAMAVVVFIFIYTYFATSVARGAIYMFAPLDESAPPFVVESMEKGHYTDKDMRVDNAAARNKFLTRPFFTYQVFLDVIDTSYPLGKSHGRLMVSLLPGMTKGRATTISILKKPLSTSFFGIPFLEFGLLGVVVYGVLLGFSLAVISRFKNYAIYALTLTMTMLWLDTGPSVWWHWLPFATAFPAAASLLIVKKRKHSLSL
jgi:hypothetical protein